MAEPPPEAPEPPTNVRVVEYGQTFLVWEWDPVEAATGYEVVVFPEGTPVPERPPSSIVSESTYRAEGLEPGTAWELVMRSLRETAGGRAASPWVGKFSGSTWGEPRECSVELEHAMNFGVSLPVEWMESGGTPFRFYFDSTSLPVNEREDAAHVLATIERLSDRIEDQIGYSIIEVGGWTRLPSQDCREIAEWREPGSIVALVIPEDHIGRDGKPVVGTVAARRNCNVVRYSSGDVKIVRDSIAPHEVFHLLGFTHSRTRNEKGNLHPSQTPVGEGVAMSNPLTHGTDPPDLGVTFEDVDALRCVFPKR